MARGEFSAGTVYVHVVPELSGWTKAVRDQLKAELAKAGFDPKKGVPIAVDPQINDKALAREIKRITQAHKGELILQPKLDEKGLKKEAEKAAGFFSDTFRRATQSTVTALPEFDDEHLDDVRRELVEIRTEAEELSKLRVGIDIDEHDALAAIDILTERAKELDRQAVTIQARADASQAFMALDALRRKMHATSTAAQDNIRDIQAAINRIEDRRVNLEIDSAQARAELDVLEARLAEIRGQTLSVHIRAEADQALATIHRVDAALEHLDGQQAHVEIKTDTDKAGGFDFSLPLRARTKALITLAAAGSGALGGLGAAFLTVAAGAVTAGAAVATFAVGMTDIAAAMKAQSDASRQAGQTAAQEAAQRLVAADQVINAQDAVAHATQNVADAQRAASTSVRRALQAQARAEQDLAGAQVDALRAQQALTDARRDAERSLQDLNLRVTSDALAQRQAILDVAEAQENLNTVLADPAATERQRQEAQLTFDQATQRLTEVSLAYQRSQADAADANAAGVEGAQEVVAAQDRLVDAHTRVRDAEVASHDAAEAVTDARVSGAAAVLDAQRQLAGAQRSLTDAQARAAVQAQNQGEAQDKLGEAWARLTPQSRQLVSYLRAQSGEWDTLRQATQGFVPGLLEGLQILAPHMGTLTKNVGTLSAAFGGFLTVIARGLVDAEPLFTMIADASRTLFPRLGESVNRAGQAVGGLAVELLPLADNTLDVADAASDLITAWTPFIASASGPLLDSLKSLLDNMKVLGPLLDAIAKPAAELTTALGTGLSQGLSNLVSGGLQPFLAACVRIIDTLSPLLASLGQLAGQLTGGAVPALTLLNTALNPVVGVLKLMVNLLTLLPAPVTAFIVSLGLFHAAVARYSPKIATAFTNLGTGVATATQRLSGSEGAATKVASGFAKVGSAVGKLGSYLPVIGLAFAGLSLVMDNVGESAQRNNQEMDRLAAMFVRGGSAAAQAARDMEATRSAIAGLLGSTTASRGAWLRSLEESSRGENEAIKRAKALAEELGPLGVAQERATQAQKDYLTAVRDHGKNSQEAGDALALYQYQVRGVERVQRDAAEATKSTTQRMLEQQDNILAMGDAQASFRQAGLNLRQAELRIADARARSQADTDAQAQAQKDYNAAVAQFPRNSAQVLAAQRALADTGRQAEQSALGITSAQLDMEQAQSRYVASAGAAAEATAKANKVNDDGRSVLKAHNDALIEMLRTYGDTLPPVMLSAIAAMGEAEKAAYGLGVEVDQTGQTILHLPGAPGQPAIDITFTSNIKQIDAEIQAVIDKLRVSASKLVGEGGFGAIWGTMLSGVAGALEQAGIAAGPRPTKKARGGPVGGTGTGDTVPILATPGEFVFSRPAVRTLGLSTVASLHQRAVQGFATGGVVRPLRFAEGGTVPAASGGIELADIAILIDLFADITAAAGPATAAITDGLIPALHQLADVADVSSRTVRTDWQAMAAVIGTAVTQIVTAYLPSLRTGLALTDAAMAATAQGFAAQWQAVARSAADPVRWMLANPFTALINAWNVINTTFAAGKPLAPVPITFAAGGPVSGGVPGQDSVPALLMPGEFVAPVPMVQQIGMSNLEAARRSVLGGGSAEGVVGFEAGGAVTKAMAFARANAGKPYLWGGVGPTGFDCSGWMSAIANVALGDYPYRRRFTTAQFSPGRGAGGFVPGSGSTFVIGVSDAHMAGNLAGTNLESTTKNGFSGTRVGGDAASPTDPQFTKGTFFLPQIGGTFLPSATGSPFDITSLLDSTFTDTRAQIAAMGSLFGANTMAAAATAELTQMLSTVVGWAQATLAAPLTGGATGPVADQVRAVAARWGWGAGPQWDALSTLISHESGWNPTSQNPTSTAWGLFQFLDSTWAGTGIGKTSDPTLQTEAGLRYISGRYRDPIGAWSYWSRNHWYDDGGVLPPGMSLAYNGTGKPEPVLSPRQWDTLAAHTATTGGRFTGELYLDSGQFLGVVDGQIAAANELTARSLARRTRL